jgi:hypothetical protein
MNTEGDIVVYAAHYYNAFQEGDEYVSAHTCEDNAAEFRLVMDFSSIEPGIDLFEKEPIAYLDKHKGEPNRIKFEWRSERVFSAVEMDVPKHHTLTIKWRIKWGNLSTV